jgi:opacity protein-like surface antigen
MVTRLPGLRSALAIGAVVLAVAPQARADGYIRPLLQYVSATNVSADAPDPKGSKLGGGIAVGCCLGANDEIDLGIEFSTCEIKAPSYDTYSGIYPYGQSFQNTDSLRLQPLLGIVRYQFGNKAARVRPYLGLAVGFTNLTARSIAKNTTNSTVSEWSGSGTYFTAGGLGGIQIRLSDQIDLDVGYRYCGISSSDLTGANVNTSTLYAGVGVRF